MAKYELCLMFLYSFMPLSFPCFTIMCTVHISITLLLSCTCLFSRLTFIPFNHSCSHDLPSFDRFGHCFLFCTILGILLSELTQHHSRIYNCSRQLLCLLSFDISGYPPPFSAPSAVTASRILSCREPPATVFALLHSYLSSNQHTPSLSLSRTPDCLQNRSSDL